MWTRVKYNNDKTGCKWAKKVPPFSTDFNDLWRPEVAGWPPQNFRSWGSFLVGLQTKA